MSEEINKPKETKEPQKPGGNPGEAQASPNGAVVPEDLEAIKARLEAEKQAKAAVEAALAERDARIAQLEADRTGLVQQTEGLTSELAQVKGAHLKAVSKYLEATKAANPTIPGDVIAGGTIEEIEASVAKAVSIATAVKANLEAQAKEAKVPAGAPTRGEISLEGLTPREKIAVGIQQKGGTQ